MKVSVIVPVYNHGKYIERCLYSVINQSYRDIEVIIVNDGSTDETSGIIEAIAATDPRVVNINQENAGTHVARLTGIKSATGDAIMNLDADDYLESNAIALLVQKMELTAADIVFGNYYFHRLGKTRLVRNFDPSEVSNIELLRQILLGNLSVHLWGKLYRRSLLADISLPITRAYTEDVLTNFNILCKYEVKAALVEDAILNYVIHDSNVSYSDAQEPVEGFFNEFKYVEDLLNEHKLTPHLQDEIAVYKCKNWLIYCRKKGILTADKKYRKSFKHENYHKAKKYLPGYLKLEFNAYTINYRLGRAISTLMIWVKRNFMSSFYLKN